VKVKKTGVIERHTPSGIKGVKEEKLNDKSRMEIYAKDSP
jgi:hypothetical protein